MKYYKVAYETKYNYREATVLAENEEQVLAILTFEHRNFPASEVKILSLSEASTAGLLKDSFKISKDDVTKEDAINYLTPAKAS